MSRTRRPLFCSAGQSAGAATHTTEEPKKPTGKTTAERQGTGTMTAALQSNHIDTETEGKKSPRNGFSRFRPWPHSKQCLKTGTVVLLIAPSSPATATAGEETAEHRGGVVTMTIDSSDSDKLFDWLVKTLKAKRAEDLQIRASLDWLKRLSSTLHWKDKELSEVFNGLVPDSIRQEVREHAAKEAERHSQLLFADPSRM